MGDLALVGANGAGEAMVAVAETPRQRFGLPLAVLSGLCLAAAFPSLEIAPLAWIGLVPLLFAIRGRTPGAAFRLGWTTGTVFFLVTCYKYGDLSMNWQDEVDWTNPCPPDTP